MGFFSSFLPSFLPSFLSGASSTYLYLSTGAHRMGLQQGDDVGLADVVEGVEGQQLCMRMQPMPDCEERVRVSQVGEQTYGGSVLTLGH